MSILMSPAPSVASGNDSEFDRCSRRSTHIAATAGDGHSAFNVSLYQFQSIYLPMTRLRELPKNSPSMIKESYVINTTPNPRQVSQLFPITHAEKCQLATCSPIVFSKVAYLELVIESMKCCPFGSQPRLYSYQDRTRKPNLKRIPTNVHPLAEMPTHLLALIASQDPVKHLVQSIIPFAGKSRIGVTKEDAIHLSRAHEVENGVCTEIIEMGDPISPLRRAMIDASKAGYGNHEPVVLGVEAQPMGLQFTRFRASYEKINLQHEWFRACGEFEDNMEFPVYSSVGSALWEQALQTACNARYYKYIQNTCYFGMPLPPRLDLRPLEFTKRCLKYEVFTIPKHDRDVGDYDQEDCARICGAYCMEPSSLRHEVFLDEYAPNHDPRVHVLFQSPNEGAERWRARNITEDGTLYRTSRRDVQPTQYSVKGLDLPLLFSTGRCRRFFPRLQSSSLNN